MKALKMIGRGLLELLALASLLVCAAVLVLAMIAPASAAGSSATVSWIAPTQYTDDSPLPASELKEYLVEWRKTAAGPLVGAVKVAAPATTVTVPGLSCGGFLFTVAAVTTANVSSSASSPPVAYATGIACTPKAPTGLSAS